MNRYQKRELDQKMNPSPIIKSAFGISIATLISRILGYIRDALNASLFGAGFISDAYFAAYRIPNLLRDLLAEGSLSSAFIPTFTEYLTTKDKKEVWELTSVVFNTILILFSALIILGEFFSPLIVRIMVPGFASDAFLLSVKLLRIMFPFIAFLSFAALFMGILNSNNNFIIPALAPAVFNLVIIIFGVFICPIFGDNPDKQIIGWSIGTLVAGLFQALFQIPSLIKIGIKFRFIFNFRHPGLKKIFSLMFPTIFSNSIAHINVIFINIMIASLLGPAIITYLYYGFRIMQLPLGIFGYAIATAAFPVISMYAAKKDYDSLKNTVSFSLRNVFFITLPATAGLIALSLPINKLLFFHGKFTYDAVIATSYVASIYCIGLFAIASSKVISQTFYALNDSVTPVKIGIFTIILNIILSLIFIEPFKYYGLPIANSIAVITQFLLLIYFLSKKIGGLDKKSILNSLYKILVISCIMGISTWLFSGLIKQIAIQVFGSIIFGVIIYIALSYVFKIEELKNLKIRKEDKKI